MLYTDSIPPRQVYNLTFCKVVPVGDDQLNSGAKNVETAQGVPLTDTSHPVESYSAWYPTPPSLKYNILIGCPWR
jgi:hypothetical protein